MKRHAEIPSLCLALLLPGAAHAAVGEVLDTYADIAHATYEDSLHAARGLQAAIDRLLAEPGAAALDAARQAWRAARVPYQQSEAYRFGNAIVDDWEGRVNAWPLDEGLIDYVDAGYAGGGSENPYYMGNIIAGRLPDGAPEGRIGADWLRELHEVDEIEANVTIGYHPIEFLLWGQDLHGTAAGAGARPWTDFLAEGCTGGHCERRRAYLQAVAGLLVEDLEEMVAHWADGGDAREAATAAAEDGLRAIVAGLGSLSYGELAGERMQLGLLLHDPEEEHDCFSDNTHNSHYYDAVGIRNVYTGRYARIDGRVVEGPGLADLVRAEDESLDAEMRTRLEQSLAALGRIKRLADSGAMSYDQMLGADNEEGNALVQDAVDALRAQTETLGKIAAALELDGLEFEGSDSLDDPEAVFQ